jgi:hypothetical protein
MLSFLVAESKFVLYDFLYNPIALTDFDKKALTKPVKFTDSEDKELQISLVWMTTTSSITLPSRNYAKRFLVLEWNYSLHYVKSPNAPTMFENPHVQELTEKSYKLFDLHPGSLVPAKLMICLFFVVSILCLNFIPWLNPNNYYTVYSHSYKKNYTLVDPKKE